MSHNKASYPNPAHGPETEDNKFSVKDVMHMLNEGVFGEIFHTTGSDEEARSRLKELHTVLQCEQILADLERAKTIVLPPIAPKSDEILTIPSDSLSSIQAVKDVVYQEKEELVSREVYNIFILRLRGKALANSTMKKPPIPVPPPSPTWHDRLRDKTLRNYYQIYGTDKPKPKYPILSPRERPPPPVVEPKKKKKGKKGKKKKAPPPPVNMTVWRKENLPVASCRLWLPFFRALPCHQRTPNLSNPPTPPVDVPEPMSLFGYFINNMSPDEKEEKRERRSKMSGHYSPKRIDESESRCDNAGNTHHQTMDEFPPEYQTIINLEKVRSQQFTPNLPCRPEYLDEANFFKKYDLENERKLISSKLPITRQTVTTMASDHFIVAS